MAKALKPIIIILLLLSIASLVLGIKLFNQREILKGRVQKNEQALATIAKNIHYDQFNSAELLDYTTMQAALNKLSTAAEIQYEDLQNTKQDLENTRADLAQTKDELATTKLTLEQTQAEVARLGEVIVQKDSEIASANMKIDGLEQEKTGLQVQIDDLNEQIAQMGDEKLELEDKLATQDSYIKELEAELNKGGQPVLPKGLSGKILVINKDWNFVIIDIGSDHGLAPNAELLVHRGEELVGKVAITGVSRNLAIADIKGDWIQSPLKEGDYVVH